MEAVSETEIVKAQLPESAPVVRDACVRVDGGKRREARGGG